MARLAILLIAGLRVSGDAGGATPFFRAVQITASTACPDYSTVANVDFDGNGVGDECECGDQTQDAVVNALDILGMSQAIFGKVRASPLCDTNYDGLCNVSDIVGANQKIFGRPAYCSRYPPP